MTLVLLFVLLNMALPLVEHDLRLDPTTLVWEDYDIKKLKTALEERGIRCQSNEPYHPRRGWFKAFYINERWLD